MSKAIQNVLQRELKEAMSRSVVNRQFGLKPIHPSEFLREEFLIPPRNRLAHCDSELAGGGRGSVKITLTVVWKVTGSLLSR